VHVTTVFVTHDQEEALEVADEIVVINEGRVEQIGSPDQLYDEPANDFVMRFLGPVTQLGSHLVRPHDLDLLTADPGDASRGRIVRVTRIGFELRIEVAVGDQTVLVTLTRTEYGALNVEEGSTVWLRVTPGAPTVEAVTPLSTISALDESEASVVHA
jgi:sulfate transport system ATP-binding protein